MEKGKSLCATHLPRLAYAELSVLRVVWVWHHDIAVRSVQLARRDITVLVGIALLDELAGRDVLFLPERHRETE